MKIWVDSKNAAPDDSYIHCISVDDAIMTIKKIEAEKKDIKIVDLGKIVDEKTGGRDKRVEILYWLQDNCKDYTVKFQSDKEAAAN